MTKRTGGWRSRCYRTGSLGVVSVLLVSACGGSDDPPPLPPRISVSTSSVSADVGGESVSVGVSNAGGGTLNWTASIPSGVGWARISSGASGTGSGTVQIEVDKNSGAAREFALTISARGATSQTVTVRQADAPAVLDLSSPGASLDGNGGNITLTVRNAGHATMPWTATLPDDVEWAWIESGASGSDDGEVVVRYNRNGGEDRELEVTVAAPQAANSPQSVSLSQDWFATAACTYAEARGEVMELLREAYYFNDEPAQRAKYANLALEDYKDLDALLEAIRWMPETRDRGFTHWETRAEYEAVFAAESYLFGFRPSYALDLRGNPIYIQALDVYQGSPAGDAGLRRGDKIVSLNGKSIEGLSLDEIDKELGPNEDGYTATFEIESLSGQRRTFEMAKRLVRTPTVPEEHVEIFETAAGKVGYLHFRTFFGDANDRLLEEFAAFKSAGVRNLIVDLRYNGGGSVPIAHGLASLIGGPELFEAGKRTVLSRRIHNNLLATVYNQNETTYFGCSTYGAPELVAKCENESSLRDLEKVVFITSGGSASASEFVITALQPHENVALVGERTFGKPVGQYGYAFCPRQWGVGEGVLWPVSFANVNSEGFGDYYSGLEVECEVEDDLTKALGTADEGRIAVALRYIETGSCRAPASSLVAGEARLMQLWRQRPVARFLGY